LIETQRKYCGAILINGKRGTRSEGIARTCSGQQLLRLADHRPDAGHGWIALGRPLGPRTVTERGRENRNQILCIVSVLFTEFSQASINVVIEKNLRRSAVMLGEPLCCRPAISFAGKATLVVSPQIVAEKGGVDEERPGYVRLHDGSWEFSCERPAEQVDKI